MSLTIPCSIFINSFSIQNYEEEMCFKLASYSIYRKSYSFKYKVFNSTYLRGTTISIINNYSV